MSKYIKVRV